MVKSIKYLGYTFTKMADQREHIKDITKRAYIAMLNACRIVENKFKNNFYLQMFLFDKLVNSIMMYGAEVWGWV